MIDGAVVNLGSTNVVVGSNSPNTLLILTNNSSLTNAAGYIGLNPSSSNNQVVVTGNNTTWVNTGDLVIGNLGSGNTLSITNNGGVQAASAYVGAEAGSADNLVAVGPGTLTLTNSGGTAVLDVRRGDVVLNGGTLVADHLLLTNAAGQFILNSGTLITRQATISNGQEFVVGPSAGSGRATWDVRSNASPTLLATNLIVGSQVANALRFNGALQYVAVTNFNAIAPTNEVTVEFWALAEIDAEQSAFMLEPDEVTNRFNAHISYLDGRTYWDFGNTSNALGQVSAVNPPNTLSNWVHYALVASQSGNFMRIYRNGILATNRSGMTPFLRRNQELRIGGSSGYFFRGRMDEFRLWKSARSGSQIQSNMAQILSGTESDLVLYYRFDSTTGNVATNSAVATGAAYNGTLMNGPTWHPSDAFQTIASNQDSAALLLTNGGRLIVDGSTYIGNTASASNNYALVGGPGTLWSNRGSLNVGSAGSFNSLIIRTGATVAGRQSTVGQLAGSKNNQVVVDGTGSLWTSSESLEVGRSGTGSRLLITNGGTVSSSVGTIGVNPGAHDNQVVVSGPNSRWTSTDLNIGWSGASNRLLIERGGQVGSAFGYIGYQTEGRNNQVSVNGSGSLWSNSQDVFVGLYGSRSTLSVTNGGRAENRSGYIGYGALVTDNQGIVAGSNSVWINSDQLQVGNAGSGNRLWVAEGGQVASGQGLIGNATGANHNQASISGANSRWNNAGGFRIGNFGSFNHLAISNGGGVLSGLGFLGHDSESSNNTAVVTGPNSVWSNQADLSIGFQGPNNVLVVSDGGRAVQQTGVIGYESTADNNRVIVSGSNSAWISRNDLLVGQLGSGNVLALTNGATAQAANVSVGAEAGSAGNLLTVNNSILRVTNTEGTGLLDVRRGTVVFNGGTIAADRLQVTNPASAFLFNSGTLVTRHAMLSNGQFFVVGSGGGAAEWDLRSSSTPSLLANGLILGLDSGNSRLWLTNGARLVTGSSSTIGQSEVATNNTVVVSGGGSTWDNNGFLYVGFDGAGNTLLITNGGRVRNEFGFVGESPLGGGNLNQVIVSGSQSQWSNRAGLFIGSSGWSNALRIQPGGSVWAANVTVGANSEAVGNLIELTGGQLMVTNAGGTAELDLRRGSIVLNEGAIITDRLLATNAASTFAFNGGTLDARSTSIANGQVFNVGNGAITATYRLSGLSADSHAFANGLVIASNATLTGNGTIEGAVTNRGVLAPGTSAGSLTINGSLNLAASAGMSFEIGGLIATNQYDQLTVTSFVQFAGTFSLALINGFTPGAGDSFTLMRYASSTGSFANATNGAVVLTSDQKRQFTVNYGTTNLVVGNFTASLYLTSITPSPGQVAVRFQFMDGKAYEIQYSSTLTNWTPVVGATFTEPQPGIRQWIDDGTLTGGLPDTRFYRARQLP